MKKLVCMMIVFVLAIAAVTALAESATYTDRDGDCTFTYDADVFEITAEGNVPRGEAAVKEGKIELTVKPGQALAIIARPAC